MFVWTMHVGLWKTQKVLTFSPKHVPYTTRFNYNFKDAIFYSTSNISNEIGCLSTSQTPYPFPLLISYMMLIIEWFLVWFSVMQIWNLALNHKLFRDTKHASVWFSSQGVFLCLFWHERKKTLKMLCYPRAISNPRSLNKKIGFAPIAYFWAKKKSPNVFNLFYN
jgi:hypothetical protein